MIILDATKDCLSAATVDQSSLYDKLCHLAHCLSRWNGTISRIEDGTVREEHHVESTNGNDIKTSDDQDDDIISVKENVASSLLELELVRTGKASSTIQQNIRDKVDECMDLCGRRISFMMAIDKLQTISPKTIKSNTNTNWKSCIMSSSHVIRRMLLEKGDKNYWNGTDDGALPGSTLHSFLGDYITCDNDETSGSSTQTPRLESSVDTKILHFINSVIITLPTQFANAFHSCQLQLPLWATRRQFFTTLIETAAVCATSEHKTEHYRRQEGDKMKKKTDLNYLKNLTEVLLRHGHSDFVCEGMYSFWHNLKISRFLDSCTNKTIQEVINGATKGLSSPRSCAILLRSSIRKVISDIEMYPSKLSRSRAKLIVQKECMPFLNDISCSILSEESNYEMLTNLMILSPSTTDDSSVQKLLTRCVVELLGNCSYEAEIESPSEQDTGMENSEHLVLYRCLFEVTDVWNDKMFVNETDRMKQKHITSFILDAMDYIKPESHNENLQEIIHNLVTGVTLRLEVSEKDIRHDGMMVAEKMAPLLKQELRFDELDEVRSTTEDDELCHKDIRADKNKTGSQQQIEQNITKGKMKRRKKVPVVIDPDEENDSDLESAASNHSDNCTLSCEDSSDVDSDWDEENLVPCSLSDDEDDLRPFPKPNYLHECLTLLQSPEDDHDAKYMHEVALKEVVSLVRDYPPDLSDLAPQLSKVLLYIENRYNFPSFAQLRWDGLCALTVCSPTSTIPFLQSQLFSNIGLGLHFDILQVIKYSCSELCGQLAIEKWRSERCVSCLSLLV
jgi:telomere length regulation protein